MLHWLDLIEDGSPQWLQLEDLSCRPTTLHFLLCSKLPLPEPVCRYSINPVVKHSLKIWAQFRRAFLFTDLLINAPISRNNMFKPSVIDGSFDIWTGSGLITLRDLYIDGTFASFQQLRLKYSIPTSHFFRYLQLIALLPHIQLTFRYYHPALSLILF